MDLTTRQIVWIALLLGCLLASALIGETAQTSLFDTFVAILFGITLFQILRRGL